jgi:hypothetical protein
MYHLTCLMYNPVLSMDYHFLSFYKRSIFKGDVVCFNYNRLSESIAGLYKHYVYIQGLPAGCLEDFQEW